jgi:hypothetical protein
MAICPLISRGRPHLKVSCLNLIERENEKERKKL